MSHSTQENPMSAKAQRLAFLLVQSAMPQEQKEGWMNVLPLMAEEQVDLLMKVLEQEHGTYVTASQDLIKSLKELEHSLAHKMQKLQSAERELIDQFIHNKLSEYNKTV